MDFYILALPNLILELFKAYSLVKHHAFRNLDFDLFSAVTCGLCLGSIVVSIIIDLVTLDDNIIFIVLFFFVAIACVVSAFFAKKLQIY